MQDYKDDILPHLIMSDIFPSLPILPTEQAKSEVDFKNDKFDENRP